MKIDVCDNLEAWNKGLSPLSRLEFLQSWAWGEFQAKIGNKPVCFLVDGQSVQGFEYNIGLGKKFLYLPRVYSSEFIVQSLIEKFRKSDYIFLRIEPLELISEPRTMNYEIVRNRQPQQTLILNINQTEEEILNQMHPKTRYNIHLSERKGVEVREEKNVDVFWQLNLDTTGRDGFRSHNKKYYEEMLKQENVFQLIAYYNQEPIASNILVVSGEVITYLHGASANKFRNLMAPYLLQWQGILLGKKNSCHYYDFWGVAPLVRPDEKNQKSSFHGFCWPVNHSWSGVTRFKVGFGGEYREYSEAIEVPLKKYQYKIFSFLKKLRS